jgi:hypothetical protein
VTDLSFMYTCGKCSRNFATPARLKNHEIPCRGKYVAGDFDPLLSQLASKDLGEHSPKRGLPTSDWVPERATDEYPLSLETDQTEAIK